MRQGVERIGHPVVLLGASLTLLLSPPAQAQTSSPTPARADLFNGCEGAGPAGPQAMAALFQQLSLGDNGALRLSDEWQAQGDYYIRGFSPPPVPHVGLSFPLLDAQGLGGGGLGQLREAYPASGAGTTVFLERSWRSLGGTARLGGFLPVSPLSGRLRVGGVVTASLGYYPASDPQNAVLNRTVALGLPLCLEAWRFPMLIPAIRVVETGSGRQTVASVALGAHVPLSGAMVGGELLGSSTWTRSWVEGESSDASTTVAPALSLLASGVGAIRLPQVPQIRLHARGSMAMGLQPAESGESSAQPVVAASLAPGVELRPSAQFRLGFGGSGGGSYLASDNTTQQIGGWTLSGGLDSFLLALINPHLAAFVTLEISATQRTAADQSYQGVETGVVWQLGMRGRL